MIIVKIMFIPLCVKRIAREHMYLNLIPQLGGHSVEGTWCIRCKLESIFFNFVTNNTNPKLELLQTRN